MTKQHASFAESFNFDQPPSRLHSGSLKWSKFSEDVIPMWVADMDFEVAPAITEALQQHVSHGIFGYAQADEELTHLIVERCKQHYQWQIEPEWIVWLPNLVTALHLCARTFCTEQESVIAPMPVYHHFLMAAHNAQRHLIELNWTEHNGKAVFDIAALEQGIADAEKPPKLLLLCNPHNPNGRVLSREELTMLDALCQKHHLTICSDEIHCDLILDQDAQHIPYASISEYAQQNSITLMSASKTFNIAGFCCAYAIIPNAALRERFNNAKEGIIPPPDALGYVAAEAAYQHGTAWHTSVVEYLRGNHDYLLNEINAIDGLSMRPLQATYLAWINIGELKLTDPTQFFLDAGVAIIAGAQFGDANYIRLNFACSRALLEEAVRRIKQAITQHTES